MRENEIDKNVTVIESLQQYFAADFAIKQINGE